MSPKRLTLVIGFVWLSNKVSKDENVNSQIKINMNKHTAGWIQFLPVDKLQYWYQVIVLINNKIYFKMRY